MGAHWKWLLMRSIRYIGAHWKWVLIRSIGYMGAHEKNFLHECSLQAFSTGVLIGSVKFAVGSHWKHLMCDVGLGGINGSGRYTGP